MSIARSITIVTSLIVAMILTRLLSQSYYGSYRKLWLIFALIGPSLMSSSVGTLYYRSGIARNRSVAVYAVMIQSFMFGLSLALLVFFGAPILIRFFNAGHLLIPLKRFSIYMGFIVFAGLAEPVFVVLNRKKWLLGYNLVFNFLDVFLIIIPFYFHVPLKNIVLIMAIGPVLRTVFIGGLVSSQLHDSVAWGDLKKELRKSFYYAIGLFFVAIAGMASVEVDKWVVSNYYVSDLMYAVYAIGARKIPFLSAVTSSITSSLIVHYSSQIKNNNYEEILRAIRSVTDKLFLLILPLLAWLFVFAREVMVILFQKYAASAPIFRIYLFIIITNFFFAQSILLGKGMSRINAWIGAAEVLINIIMSLLLVRFIGMIGPAIATLIAHWAFQLMIMWYCRQKYDIPIRQFLPTYKIWPVLMTVPAIIFMSSVLNNWFQSGIIAFIVSGFITAFVIWIQLLVLNNKAEDVLTA